MNTDPPCISISPSQSPYRITVGSTLTLYCSAKGLPLPTVQWYVNGSATNQQPPEIIIFQPISPHTTVFTCVATNNAGNMTHTVSKSITVTVIVKGMKLIIVIEYVYYTYVVMCCAY